MSVQFLGLVRRIGSHLGSKVLQGEGPRGHHGLRCHEKEM
jgi:hypothetical protein